jgi:membrane-associated PAP2 superfamily phosphatase
VTYSRRSALLLGFDLRDAAALPRFCHMPPSNRHHRPTKRPAHRTRKRHRYDLAWLIVLFALILWWDVSGWDMVVARVYGSHTGFEWRTHWLWSSALHDQARWLSPMALLGLAAWASVEPDAAARADLIWALAACVLATLGIWLLKRATHAQCPWDLRAFGGTSLPLAKAMFAAPSAWGGHCSPAAHAAHAFGFLPLWAVWRHRDPERSLWLAQAIWITGTVFSFAQVARGAHFVSQGLCTAWLCLAMAVGADALRRHWLRKSRQARANR